MSSILYSFHIAAELKASRLRALLGVSEAGALPDAYGVGRPTYVLIKSNEPDPIDDALFRSAYGFAPRVTVTVELAKSAPDEQARERPALDVLRALLRQLDDDMYVSYLGDYPVLVRHHGSTVVDARWLEHHPWFSDSFPQAYTVAELVDPYSEPVSR